MMAMKLHLTSLTLGKVDIGIVRDMTSGKINVGQNGRWETVERDLTSGKMSDCAMELMRL